MRRSNTVFTAALLLLGAVLPVSAGADIRDEANREANRLFLATRAACGADYALAIDVTPAPPSGFAPALGETAAPKTGHTLYLVMSGVTSTPAKTMNVGPEWQGRISFVAERARIISISRDGTRGAWTPVAGGEIYAVDIAYRQGWTTKVHELALLANLGRFAKARRPACSDVPAGQHGS
ncbi:hypothetical protein [Bosea sp. (in: a-proteobacteria)]|uniref:hypothetical protein n=1 Tax=Bosea sp. (in: a-proteobacteria) TaxID=1871050 RepID=UPI0025B8285C|nr:hypothetical protein [Bosea sp. (in: a-proteobacteria)]